MLPLVMVAKIIRPYETRFVYKLIKRQSCHHKETSQLICSANQWTGFYQIATLAFNELKVVLHDQRCSYQRYRFSYHSSHNDNFCLYSSHVRKKNHSIYRVAIMIEIAVSFRAHLFNNKVSFMKKCTVNSWWVTGNFIYLPFALSLIK